MSQPETDKMEILKGRPADLKSLKKGEHKTTRRTPIKTKEDKYYFDKKTWKMIAKIQSFPQEVSKGTPATNSETKTKHQQEQPPASPPKHTIRLNGGKYYFDKSTWHVFARILSFFSGNKKRIAIVLALAFLKKAVMFMKKHKAPTSLFTKSIVHSRFFGFIVENMSVFAISYIRYLLPCPKTVESVDDEGKPVTLYEKLKQVAINISIALTSCLIAEEGTMLMLHLVSSKIYGNVPYFAKQNGRKGGSSGPFTRNGLASWLKGNGILQILGGGLALGLVESFIPKSWAEEVNTTTFKPLEFLRKFVYFRVVVDIVFYAAHRAMHSHPTLYKLVHREHHREHFTNLASNYHFTAPDLFMESAFPMFSAFSFIRSLGMKMGRFEMYLMMDYLAWYELGSHLGKPLKVISMFPPLSFLYNSLYPIDDFAIRFHEVHHNRRHGNYGITPWMDMLLRTTVA